MDWRDKAACLTVDPELFFPVGNTGPAVDQIEKAGFVERVPDPTDARARLVLRPPRIVDPAELLDRPHAVRVPRSVQLAHLVRLQEKADHFTRVPDALLLVDRHGSLALPPAGRLAAAARSGSRQLAVTVPTLARARAKR